MNLRVVLIGLCFVSVGYNLAKENYTVAGINAVIASIYILGTNYNKPKRKF